MPSRAVRLSALTNAAPELRRLADQAFSRAAGAPLTSGNHVEVLRDAAENYPAWERAILDARHSIHVEMYIIHRDETGRRFVELLAERARAGVAVRVIYDWFGCGFGPLFGLFRPLIAAGAEVRVFNPPSITAVLGWVRRNHRKLLIIDGRIAFVAGLCVGDMWVGHPARGIPPWRDTGIALRGPAVAEAEISFAESWRLTGGSLDRVDLMATSEPPGPAADPVMLRFVPTVPFTANLLRVDLLITLIARRTLWVTDAYFIGNGMYLEALRRAALDGVDVRLLLPQGSDVGWTVPVSRTLYRSLLEAGVRIFEWNGSMVHAKTAVADGRWSRVGSTNLNLNSWVGNWELDVIFDDEGVASTLEGHYVEDLTHATEICLTSSRRRIAPARPRVRARGQRARRSARRAVRTVTGLGRSLGAAITGNRPLEEFEYLPVLTFGAILIAIAVVAIAAPRVLAWPAALLAAWSGLTFVLDGLSLWRKGRR